MDFPDKITFKSDKNVMELVPGTIGFNNSKEKVASYKYTKSQTKKDMEITMQLSYIERLANSDLITIKFNKKK